MSDIKQIADKLYESDSEYISRRDASLCVNAVVTGCESKETIEALAAVLVQIHDAPLSDVAPVVHGHWENKYERHYIFFGTCSVCKHVCQENNICGNCGAIMDESEDTNNA